MPTVAASTTTTACRTCKAAAQGRHCARIARMPTPLPQPDFALAKIQPPRPRVGLIERPRLERALGRALLRTAPGAAGCARRLRQDRGADAADPPAARRHRAGLGLCRRGRPPAALPGLPVHGAGTLRPALAHGARRAADAGAGRARAARRGRGAGQRAGRGRAAARPDRARRPAPHRRPAHLRAAARADRAAARALGGGDLQPCRTAAVAGTAARGRRAGRLPPGRAAASAPTRWRRCAPRCRPMRRCPTCTSCCSAPRAGRWACA